MDDKKKSRTLTLSDSEWAEITSAAIDMGFGENARSRAVVKLARDHNERVAAKKRRDEQRS